MTNADKEMLCRVIAMCRAGQSLSVIRTAVEDHLLTESAAGESLLDEMYSALDALISCAGDSEGWRFARLHAAELMRRHEQLKEGRLGVEQISDKREWSRYHFEY